MIHKATTANNTALSTAATPESSVSTIAFVFYCLFIVSFFLHLGSRVPALGSLRIDILLCGVALLLSLEKRPASLVTSTGMRPASKLLLILVGYIVVTLPLVKWPGSVLNHGWEPFLKSILFYVLTVRTVTTEKRLKIFLVVFLGAEAFRVFEPLYLHVTTGYWGSFTNMGNYELMNRLSGAPFDIVNPNGLAFIILIVLSLSHHILVNGTGKQRIVYLALLVPMLYAMVLTGSRSGMVGLGIFALLIVWRSKHRATAMAALGIIVVVLFANMSDIERQRYLSIVDHSAKGGASAEGRVSGMWSDFRVGMERPVFGHGLGTSLEANANATGEALPSHTLYAEVFQELGFVGLAIFLLFIVRVLRNCLASVKDATARGGFLLHAAACCRDFASVLIVFSIASYGLNEPQWYLMAGLSVVLQDLSARYTSESGLVPVAAATAATPSRRFTRAGRSLVR